MLGERFFPQEVVADVPRITMVGGDHVQVEQHHGLAVYQPGLILFKAALGSIRITGSHLHFKTYTSTEAVIEGGIDSVTVETAAKGGERQ